MKTTGWMLLGLAATATALVAVSACTQDGQTQASSAGTSSDHGQHSMAMAGHEQVVELAVTSDGFVPASSKVMAGHQ